MNSENKTDFQKYVEESEKERVLQQEKAIQNYINWNEEFKKDAWSSYVFKLLQNHRFLSSTHEPELIDFTKFRKDNLYSEVENDIDRFLPWILTDLQDFYWNEWNPLEIIFKLDEQAKKAIEVQSNVNNNLWQVNEVLDWWKTENIEWINISYEELSEKVGDLYYDSLAVFIADLKDNIDNKEVKSLLNEAFSNISIAWDYCKKPVEDYLESIKEQPEKVRTFKHTNQIKWVDIENKELAKRVWNLVDTELAKFLEAFSEKMYKDWVADDKQRWRVKLAAELYSCADKLKQSSEVLKK